MSPPFLPFSVRYFYFVFNAFRRLLISEERKKLCINYSKVTLRWTWNFPACDICLIVESCRIPLYSFKPFKLISQNRHINLRWKFKTAEVNEKRKEKRDSSRWRKLWKIRNVHAILDDVDKIQLFSPLNQASQFIIYLYWWFPFEQDDAKMNSRRRTFSCRHSEERRKKTKTHKNASIITNEKGFFFSQTLFF